jgi:2-polyprenyl-3-methyl-5-hydroxy-6-metoxy-1,4-benzoquinol methylase
MRLALRGVHYADRAGKLDSLYRIEDPWEMRSAREQARFDWTNRIIAENLAPLETVLEIGCGEGHQSQHLARQCRGLYGIDVSARAVGRARQRCPAGTFAIGDPFTLGFAERPAKFDLVVACEVLYYVKDVPRFVERIAELGRAWLVTYYQGHAETLDRHFAALAGCERARFAFDGAIWNAIWGRNPG